MKKIKTLEDALSLVPTHFPLVPGVDKWKEGDEVFNDGYNTIGWLKVHPCNYGNFIEGQNCYRRPIPQSVREAEAYLYLKIKNISNREFARVENYVSLDALIITGKTVYPLLDWVAENRK